MRELAGFSATGPGYGLFMLGKTKDRDNTSGASIKPSTIRETGVLRAFAMPPEGQLAYAVEAVRTRERLREVIPEWRRFLTKRPYGATLFNDPEYINRVLEDAGDATPNILVVRKNERIQCVGPLAVFPRRLKLSFSVYTFASFPVRMLRVFGENFVYARETDIGECLSTIFEALRKQSPHFDLLFLETFNTSSPLSEYFKSSRFAATGFRYITPLVRTEKVHLVSFEGTHEEYLASLNASTRKDVFRQCRALFRELPGVRFLKVTEPQDVKMFLDRLDVIFRQTWQMRTFGYRKRNTPEEYALLEWLAERGWLRSYVLICEEHPIAFKLGFQYNGFYHAIETGFASPYGKYSPGMVLEFLRLEDLFREDIPEMMDLGIGDLADKRFLANRSYEACPVYISYPNRYFVILRAQRLINFCYEGIRDILIKIRLDRLVRRFVKHKF
jgi:CelD/BcsL family acetyltransferase involved in cellulose biosynthesis